MSKEISFSEFLKEGTFREEKVEQVIAQAEEEKPIRIVPDAPATDKELKAFWKEARHFFRTGERKGGPNGSLIPALIAPFLKAGNYTNDYPIYISEDGNTCESLTQLIQNTMDKCFEADKAKILRANLPRILRDFKTEIKKEKHTAPFSKIWAKAQEHLHEVEVHGDKQALYLDHLEQLKEALPKEGCVVRFSDEVPFLMLQIQLKHANTRRADLMKRVKLQVAAIEEVLEVEARRKSNKEETQKTEGYDFADNLISLDKVGEMLPTEGTEGLSPKRVERLNEVVRVLREGMKRWMEHTSRLIITEALYEAFDWQGIMEGADMVKAGVNEGYKKTETTFDSSIKDFTYFIAAHRIAALELKDEFKEDIHSDFYNNFSWHRLTKEELGYFPPVIFIGETHGFLQNNLARFSALLALNKPIRLLAIDKRLVNAPNPDIDWEDASHGYRQELAALAFAHRSTHTFQCAINQPLDAYCGMKKCLEVEAPSIMHFLIPESNEVKLIEVLKLSAAVEGRFFPSITYDLVTGHKWGSRFDISANPFPDRDWPRYDVTFVDVDGEEKTQPLPFTYADYKAITKEKVEELLLIPESFKSDDLMQVSDFLQAPVEELTGKVPFIWLVDEDNVLRRAALPYMWVVSCQERLENWNFIQELGGVNSHHVEEALANAKANWDAEKAKEIEAIKAEGTKAVEEASEKAGLESMEKLTNVLLGLDSMNVSAAPAKPKAEAKPAKVKVEKSKAEKKEESTPVVEEKTATAEAFVDSFDCTTCNECTDKYPHIFKYNEDKQAYIHDAKKGKFSEMVMAAEECPASCIHPGAPVNMNEPDINEWIERAAKFN